MKLEVLIYFLHALGNEITKQIRDIRRYTVGVQPMINTDKGVDHLCNGAPFANGISGDTIRRNAHDFTQDPNLN